MKHFAVVPVKGPADAKKRLAGYLGPGDRKRLVLAMMADVLEALHRSDLFEEVMVISPDESVANEAQEKSARFVRQNGTGLNSAVRQAVRSVWHKQVSSMTIILTDLPLLEPRDLEELVHISKAVPRVVLVPSSKGGTNVMLRAPPNIIESSYGRWSYGKHLRHAQNKGVPAYSVSNPRISFDVDTIDDLRKLRRLDSSGRSNAGKLARQLGRLHLLSRNNRLESPTRL